MHMNVLRLHWIFCMTGREWKTRGHRLRLRENVVTLPRQGPPLAALCDVTKCCACRSVHFLRRGPSKKGKKPNFSALSLKLADGPQRRLRKMRLLTSMQI